MTTYTEAIDIMYGIFKAAWDNGAARIIGYAPDVEYDSPDDGERASIDKAFARVSVRNVNEGLIALGSDAIGERLYETSGVLIAQIFVPKKDNAGVVKGRALAGLVRDAYRAAANQDVWFVSATILEQPPDSRWRQFHVRVEYEFTESN